MPQKRPTLKDIARATGVHVSTVSRALDPIARTTITREVTERIQDAAARLGYPPDRCVVPVVAGRRYAIVCI